LKVHSFDTLGPKKSESNTMLQRTIWRLPLLAFITMMTTTTTVTQVHATSAGAAALSALREVDLRYFVAGGTCAAFSHGITTPIDVVKTRIQANPEKYNKGMVTATSDIIKTEGAAALLTGLGPTVLGYGVEGAMKFGIYEVSKPILKSLLSSRSKNRDPLAFIMASIFAGAIAALLLCPMESLRIKQVTDGSFAADSILTGIPKIVQQDGIGSLFRGVLAMLSKQVGSLKEKRDIWETFFLSNLHALTPRIDTLHTWQTSLLRRSCSFLLWFLWKVHASCQ
jgi:hypothetical protein